jgi:hypothetical protein
LQIFRAATSHPARSPAPAAANPGPSPRKIQNPSRRLRIPSPAADAHSSSCSDGFLNAAAGLRLRRRRRVESSRRPDTGSAAPAACDGVASPLQQSSQLSLKPSMRSLPNPFLFLSFCYLYFIVCYCRRALLHKFWNAIANLKNQFNSEEDSWCSWNGAMRLKGDANPAAQYNQDEHW